MTKNNIFKDSGKLIKQRGVDQSFLNFYVSGRLVETDYCRLPPCRVSDSVGMSWGQGIVISNKSPDAAVAADLGTISD